MQLSRNTSMKSIFFDASQKFAALPVWLKAVIVFQFLLSSIMLFLLNQVITHEAYQLYSFADLFAKANN